MPWKLGLLAIALTLGGTAPVAAQYVGFPLGGNRLSVSGYYSGGVSFGFLPFGARRYGFSSYSSGVTQQNVIIRPIILTPAARTPDYDLSGIDLDVESPDKLRAGGAAPRTMRAARQPEKAVMPRKVPDEQAKLAPVKAPAKLPPPLAEVKKPPVDDLLQPRAGAAEESKRLVELGVRAFRAQEYGVAALRFRQASELDPTNARAFFLLGQAYLAVGQFRDAARAIQVGLRLQPDWPMRGFQPRTELYVDHMADWIEHRGWVDAAVKRQPRDATYLFLRAYVAWFDEQQAMVVPPATRPQTREANAQWIGLFFNHVPGIPVAAK